MSADVDPEDQTEEPTEKRLHDATERGEVAFSREAPLFASLSATLVALIFIVPGRAETLLLALVGVIDDPAGWPIERGEDVLALADPVIVASARFLLPTAILLIAAGVLASVAQSSPRIVPDRIMPDPSRISLRKGLRRLLGARGWTEFGKSLIKLAAVIAVAATMLVGQKVVLLTAMDVDPGVLPQRVLDLCVKAIAAVLVATLAVAAADSPGRGFSGGATTA
jgi:flagellar biosynthetic protein FlhB